MLAWRERLDLRRGRGTAASATGCSRRWATAATTSSTTTSTCATRPRRRAGHRRHGDDPGARDATLSRFDLDFAGDSVGKRHGQRPAGEVRARRRGAGDHAEAAAAEGPAVRRPGRALAAHPIEPDPDDLLRRAVLHHAGRLGDRRQPDGTHVFLPSNDHPRDKASLHDPLRRAGRHDRDRQRRARAKTHVARAHALRLPAAPADGDRADPARRRPLPADQPRRPRRHPVRDAIAPNLAGLLADKLPTEIDAPRLDAGAGRRIPVRHLRLARGRRRSASRSRRRRSRSTTAVVRRDLRRPGVWEPTMVPRARAHVVRRQGRPYSWDDLWLNEGHATWYQCTFAAESGQLEENIGIADFDGADAGHLLARRPVPRRVRAGRPAAAARSRAQLFSPQVYYGGALVLYALRQQVGDAAFRALERAWVARYRDGVASTQDFIALASQVSGAGPDGVPQRRVYGTTTPPRPCSPPPFVPPHGRRSHDPGPAH